MESTGCDIEGDAVIEGISSDMGEAVMGCRSNEMR